MSGASHQDCQDVPGFVSKWPSLAWLRACSHPARVNPCTMAGLPQGSGLHEWLKENGGFAGCRGAQLPFDLHPTPPPPPPQGLSFVYTPSTFAQDGELHAQ